MTLRTTFVLLFLVMAFLLGGMVWIAGRLLESQAEVAAAGDRRLESYRLADELRQSSDDLTRMARCYAITENDAFEDWFNDILAIRNGKKARPAGYEGIYWDFLVAGQAPPESGKGRKVSLRKLMLEQGFTREEFSKLQESQRRSDALVKLETAAINAMKGRFQDELGGFTIEGDPSPEMAAELTHGEEYHIAKAEIMKPLIEFFDLLDRRTKAELAAVADRSCSQAQTLWILALTTLGVLLVAGFVVRRRVIRPVRTVSHQLRDIAEGDGDLTRRVEEGREDEVGALSHWFNVFVGRIHEVVDRTMQATHTVEAAAVQMASSSRQQEAGTAELGRVTAEVSDATNEIVGAADQLAETMAGVARSAETSAELATTGRSGLLALDQTMSRFLVATEVARTKLTAIQERTHAIDQVVTTMTTVADQTNLLSMNAAIEAEKAGEHGYGFLVVAEEIRRMADQTAGATLTIEESVAAMHAAVKEGAQEMDSLAQEIIAGTRATARVGMQLGGILDEVQGLQQRFGEVNEGMHRQARGARSIGSSMLTLQESAGQTLAALRDLGDSSEKLRDAVDALSGQVQRFRV